MTEIVGSAEETVRASELEKDTPAVGEAISGTDVESTPIVEVTVLCCDEGIRLSDAIGRKVELWLSAVGIPPLLVAVLAARLEATVEVVKPDMLD